MLVVLFCWTVSAAALDISEFELYPKPTIIDEDAFIYIKIDSNEGKPIAAKDIGILLNDRQIDVELLDSSPGEEYSQKFLFRFTASGEFDWRNIRIRIREQDYPQGPDDPYLICDAPFRVKSTYAAIPISCTIHDADEDDVQIQYVEMYNHGTGVLVATYPIWEWIDVPFHYYLFDDLDAGSFNCTEGDSAWIRVIMYCDDHDIPWIPENYTYTQVLKVRVGRELPAPDGWYYGDIHTHSRYTNNLYEYGAAPEMYASAAEAVGLSFVTITDHSCDFDASGNLWQQMANECDNFSNETVHLIGAEEVTLDDNEVNNTVDNRIHMLNYSGIFIPGPEAPITMTMHTSDRFTFLSEAIEQMEAVGGFYYAAHPFMDYDPFAYLFGLAMMPWSDNNYLLSRGTFTFGGLETWNERNFYKKDVSYSYSLNPFPWQLNPDWENELSWLTDGIAQWDEYLSTGLAQNLLNPEVLPYKMFISAGSDCHGDFNYRTFNNNPITFDVYATDNAFGVLRTCVHVPGYSPGQLPPVDEILTSYRLGRSFMTDGPCLIMGIDKNGDGDLDDEEDLNIGEDDVIYSSEASQANVIIYWESSEDWGTLASMSILNGNATSGSAPSLIWTGGPGGYLAENIIPLTDLIPSTTNGWEYLRAEAEGSPQVDGARRAFTNPVWLHIDETPTASINLEPVEDIILIPVNGGGFDYFISGENYQATSVNCDIWIDAVLPGGSIYPVINVNVNLPPSRQFMVSRNQVVPAPAPSGTYAYRAHIGNYPTSWVSDVFPFHKLSGGGQNTYSERLAEELTFNSEGNRLSEISEFLPDYALEAYPNPFNQSTVISYKLQVASYMELNVYDIQGREIAKLVDDYQTVGNHEIIFDANDLVSGVYFVRLEAGDFTATQKILMIK